ncbi:MAG: phosphoribosyltransferase family protein [Candidatus Pacearchaeota archaeon]
MMFKDRKDAGRKLARELIKQKIKADIVLAIPRGGIPVAFEVAKALKIKLDVIIPRKLPIPYDPEAGFGAVIDNEVSLNYNLLKYLKLNKKEINKIVKEVKQEIKRRMEVYRGKKPLSKVKGKTVIVVDDGLASGFTMLAAVKHLQRKKANVIIAVPVASLSAYQLLRDKAKLICLNVSDEAIFAVANFYKEWRDLSDDEVISYLEKAEK